MLKKIIIFILALMLLHSAWYLVDLPNTTRLRVANPTVSAIQKYRESESLKKGKKPHSVMVWRNLNEISPYLRQAVVLTEDDTFFIHHGFDLEQLKRAAQVDWQRKRFAFGASTITQQLARTLFLTPRKNLLRKVKEALITRKLEKTLPKSRILELYLNTVEWGPQVYGAEAAARHFYKKSAAELSVDEAISLAVILPSPRRFDPLSEKGYIAKRKSILYDRMVSAHFVDPKPEASGEPSPDDSLDEPEASPEDTL